MMRTWIAGMAAIGIAVPLGGCGGKEQAQPLSSQTFFTPVVEETPMSSVDQPGPIANNQVSVDLLQPPPSRQQQQQPARGSERSVRAVSPVVREGERRPGEISAAQPPPSTAPTAADAGAGAAAGVRTAPPATGPSRAAGSGGYMTIGAVVAFVNGKPIYADEILRQVERDLAARARELPEEQFRAAAMAELTEQVRFAIGDELLFAAAERALDQKEKDLADAMTAHWRQQRINEAGGSLEAARRRALEQGDTFEELVNQQYRMHMRQIYQQKHIFPRIQVTANDMREFYARNKDKLFTQHEQARFRLIKIGVKNIGDRDTAAARAEEVRARALDENTEFAELASEVNHDELLKRNGGDVGFIDRGSFRLEEVEEEVWSLQPGQISDIVDAGDAFYIARLEEVKEGRVRSFEDPLVQREIRSRLESEQYQALVAAERERLEKSSSVEFNPDMLRPALEMAMQRYARWAVAE